MSDSNRSRVTEPRSGTTSEWEVFLREDRSESLRHVGSVSAPNADIAREQAANLFGWAAHTLWLCRADDVERFSERDLKEPPTEPASAASDEARVGAEPSAGGRR